MFGALPGPGRCWAVSVVMLPDQSHLRSVENGRFLGVFSDLGALPMYAEPYQAGGLMGWARHDTC